MPPKKKTQADTTKKYVPSVKLRDLRTTVPYNVAGYSHLNDANPAVNGLLKAAEKNTKTLKEPHTIECVDVERGLITLSGVAEPVPVYMKVVHLLNPVALMKTREGYIDPATYNVFWDYGHSDLRFEHNKGYTETLAYHLTSAIGSERGIPHFTKWYGAVRGLADTYSYDMDEDFDVYRFRRWFWANYEAGWFDLDIRPRDTNVRMTREEIVAEFKPDDELLTDEDDDDVEEAKTDSGSTIECVDFGVGAYAYADASPIDLANLETVSMGTLETLSTATMDFAINPDSQSHKPYSDSGDMTEAASLWEVYKLHAVIPRMPVVINFLEKHEGSMDKLMEEETGSVLTEEGEEDQAEDMLVEHPIDEYKWNAWFFQVVAALTAAQEYLHLTHNDLHTNNILWKSTDQAYLFYKFGGASYKVPTYGKVFCLIDYGRAIYIVDHKHTMISSDFYDNNDAAGQYNFGPMMCEDDPHRNPNKSFDLALLAASVLRSLFYMNPRQMPKGALMTKEGDWTVRETESVLFNMLWTWLASKDKKCMYETDDGYERWEGFDLYKGLAEYAAHAVPAEQFGKAWCKKFVMSVAPPALAPASSTLAQSHVISL